MKGYNLPQYLPNKIGESILAYTIIARPDPTTLILECTLASGAHSGVIEFGEIWACAICEVNATCTGDEYSYAFTASTRTLAIDSDNASNTETLRLIVRGIRK